MRSQSAYYWGNLVKFATLEKLFLVTFVSLTVAAVGLVVPVLLSKWSLEQRIFEIGTRIVELRPLLSDISKKLRQTNDPQERERLEQEMNAIKEERNRLYEEKEILEEEKEILANLLQERQFIGLVLLLSNFIVAGGVAIFGSLRIRDEEEEKLFK